MLKKVALPCMILMLSAPLIANADIHVANDTDSYIVGSTSSGCSGNAGSRGTVNPHGSLDVPQYMINWFCGTKCSIDVFMSKTCDGNKVATITVTKNDGIVDIQNRDEEHYVITGGGNSIAIKPHARGFFRGWFNFLF